MEINAIKSEADYRATLKEIEGLMSAELNTPEGDRLDVLVTLVEAYEHKHYLMEAADPIEAIKYRMEQRGLTVGDLVSVIGPKHRVYEVLSRKRPLTISMIRRVNKELDIPAEVLIHESKFIVG